MATVGPPKIANPNFAPETWSKCTVNIYGGTIGSGKEYESVYMSDFDKYGYGGCVYGASRGSRGGTSGDLADGETIESYATVLWTEVNINPHPSDRTKDAIIAGNVYGGAQGGQVKKDTKVNLTGGAITHDAYGGGKGTRTSGATMDGIAADVGGNATVKLNEGKTGDDAGCSVRRIFGGNDLNGTPRGHILVHVYATRHPKTTKIVPEAGKYDKFNNISGYSIADYSGLSELAKIYLPQSEIASYDAAIKSADGDEAKNEALKTFENAVERKELEKWATTLQITSDIKTYQATLVDGSATAEAKKAALENMRTVVANAKYDMEAVYGGGNLAFYQPYGPLANNTSADFKATTEMTEVIIDGCKLTSIRQVYGGGNAASTPANNLTVYAAYEIDELFGGGNGKDPYQSSSDGKWYENPGANVGYYNFMEYSGGDGSAETPYKAQLKSDATQPEYREANYGYGSGEARTSIIGGRIHNVFGGSNEKGNIRELALSVYETSTDCPVIIDKSYGAGKNAEIDGEVRVQMECVDYVATQFGGSEKADVHSNVNLTITNGHFGAVYGGNNTSGHIYGSITVNIQEKGCKPIVIDELYACGLGVNAPYSVYGYYDTGKLDGGKKIYAPRTKVKFEEDKSRALSVPGVDLSDEQAVNKALLDAGLFGFPKDDPVINVISATRIGNIYGGGNDAQVIGSPHINVNMEEGFVAAKYVDEKSADFTKGKHEVTDHGVDCSYYVDRLEPTAGSTNGKAILRIGTIGTIYGGGNLAQVDGDTHIEIGTGMHHNNEGNLVALEPARNVATITGSVYGGGLGENATVTGNTFITMGSGASVYDRIYGGGSLSSVGTLAGTIIPARHAEHVGCIGKPNKFAEGTGTCNVTISGGYVGPFELLNSEAGQTITPKPMHMKNVDESGNPLRPDDYGHVFGACRGDNRDPAEDPDIEFKAYANETHVTVTNGYEAGHEGDAAYITRPLIAGSVYGGSENGHVLNDTYVSIEGGQIGLGKDKTTAFADDDFIDPATATVELINEKAAAMPETDHWDYGRIIGTEKKYLPYDEHAVDDAEYGESSKVGCDGHTFFGNVFGGGSGYYPYAKSGGGYEWLESSGLVEGNTHVTVSGGHILSNIYGGNEMTSVKGGSTVEMSGGTLGLPRTLEQIAEHPVTCYLFGGGKGDQRTHFNKRTDVNNANVTVSGGIIYGSVFGGGEDGHVLQDVNMTISGGTIGTWGTSYVEGNVFGGGRGFSGTALTAGVVCGNVNINISGGTMLGSIYGGGRMGSVGTYLASPTLANGKPNPHYGAMIPDGYDEDNIETENVAEAPGETHGHVTINISGGTIGNNHEYKFIEGSTKPTDVRRNTAYSTQSFKKKTGYVADTGETQVTEAADAADVLWIEHTKGGNVFAGGMGRQTDLNGKLMNTTNGYTADHWKKLGNVKSTKLTISGGTIKSSVFGGCEFGSVNGSHKDAGKNDVSTEIDITGGTIGSVIYSDEGVAQYTFGSVYGGGKGSEVYVEEKDTYRGGLVKGHTSVSVSGAGTKVRASVFGGGELARVEGNANVSISGGEIGLNKVRDDGYVMFGGATMGNVYGGGKGHLGHTEAGQVKGNTTVNISGGSIYHNVYGGGALASVGSFLISKGNDPQLPPIGVPYWPTGPGIDDDGKGVATVTITGGTIGISGRDNGMVFGSSRGGLSKPTGGMDEYNKLAWVKASKVTIGTADGDRKNPLIRGSVYGGGENGHNYQNATVNILSGTIGIADKNPVTGNDEPWWDFHDKNLNDDARAHRGDVYGAGDGSDTYQGDDGRDYHNPRAGMVGGSSVVNISGGHIVRSVYGAGSMGSLGNIINAADTITTTTIVDGLEKKTYGLANHHDENNSFALSWPYLLKFVPQTGKSVVKVTGGHIGTQNVDGGDVFGGPRGEAGDRYATTHMAYSRETEVIIDYPETYTVPEGEELVSYITNDYDTPCITGSVHGSGEDGFVYDDTHVTLNKGLIGHSLYGGGKGKGTYTHRLLKIGAPENSTDSADYHDAKIYSLIAGKVFGNTYVTMNGGHVVRNVYGGGNMGSVGKGNYAGGADDYYPGGYGETITGNLWTSTFNPESPESETNKKDYAWEFLNSGKTTVKVLGGTVGYIDANAPLTSSKNGLPYGNVFGGSAGEAAPNILDDPRYLYCPAFFSGYVNETDVTIGITESEFETNKAAEPKAAYASYATYEDYKTSGAPKILASVYGGGQDGHVRRDAKVVVNQGEIGLPFTSINQTLLKTTDPEAEQWLHRGNVYGAGSGISKYAYDFDYDGNTTRTGIDYTNPLSHQTSKVNEEDYSSSAGSVTRFTQVDIHGGTIHRNVYGGGSNGSVGAPTIPPTRADLPLRFGSTEKGAGWQSFCQVNVWGTVGTPKDYPGYTFTPNYGGEVFGGSRGQKEAIHTEEDKNQFATTVWTEVNVFEGAHILNNVFGGGDAGMVKKDSEVLIGGKNKKTDTDSAVSHPETP